MHDPFSFPAERVRAALAAREGAAAAYKHSPNVNTEHTLREAQQTLDYRLDQMWASFGEDKRAEIQARPIKALASV